MTFTQPTWRRTGSIYLNTFIGLTASVCRGLGMASTMISSLKVIPIRQGNMLRQPAITAFREANSGVRARLQRYGTTHGKKHRRSRYTSMCSSFPEPHTVSSGGLASPLSLRQYSKRKSHNMLRGSEWKQPYSCGYDSSVELGRCA